MEKAFEKQRLLYGLRNHRKIKDQMQGIDLQMMIFSYQSPIFIYRLSYRKTYTFFIIQAMGYA